MKMRTIVIIEAIVKGTIVGACLTLAKLDSTSLEYWVCVVVLNLVWIIKIENLIKK